MITPFLRIGLLLNVAAVAGTNGKVRGSMQIPTTARNLEDDQQQEESAMNCLLFESDLLYQIQVRHSVMVLDVDGDFIVQNSVDETSVTDRWRLEPTGDDGHHHYIFNSDTGLAITVNGGSQAQNATIRQLPVAGDGSSSWCFQDAGAGYYKLHAMHSGLSLGVTDGSLSDGAKLRQSTYQGTANQQFVLLPVEQLAEVPEPCATFDTSLVYRIFARHSSKAFHIRDDNPEKGGLLIQQSIGTAVSGEWTLSASINGNYRIININSGLELRVTDASLDNGVAIRQRPLASNPSAHGNFCFVDVGDGSYKIVGEKSGLALQVAHDSLDDGAKIEQWEYTGALNQQWVLSSVVDGEPTLSPAKITPVPTASPSTAAPTASPTAYPTTTPSLPSPTYLPSAAVPTDYPLSNTQAQHEGGAESSGNAGKWHGTYELPLIAAAAANLHDGRILMWSAFAKYTFGGVGRTYTAVFDPSTGTSTLALIRDTQHDMFCPGTAVLPDTRILITGGSDSEATTIYDPRDDTWTRGTNMIIPRGYHTMTALSDGSVFTLGGSFSGGLGNKHGEVWDAQNETWALKEDILSAGSLLTNDTQLVYRSDNHMWLFTAPNDMVFHAGPAPQMHWIDTTGSGQVIESILRGDDIDAMNGNAVMFDIGKILVIGGAPNYISGDAGNRSYVIDINGGVGGVTVQRSGDMLSPRTLGNSVVLPTGEVVVIGGVTVAKIFTDDNAVLFAEMWNPSTGIFTRLATMKIPRTYHSVALLLKDGRVLTAGGGLCEAFCSKDINHRDAEIFTPPYLLNDDGSPKQRPAILFAPDKVSQGETFTVTLDTSGSHTFVLMRLGAVTHSINNDMRRIPLSSSLVSDKQGSFRLTVPGNPAIALAGTYFLFAINDSGVPSIAETVCIR